MREAKLHDPAARQERRRAFDKGDSSIAALAGLSRTVSSAQLAVAMAEPSSNLATLKTLISNHRVLLANMRRGNEALENDNARMERELAGRPQGDVVQPGARGDREAMVLIGSTKEKLRWIENYLHDTLAQTLWALDVRAARLEEQVAVADRQEARRVLEMTHAAYDQLRSLMAELHGSADD